MDKPPLSVTQHIVLPDVLLISLIATKPPAAIRFAGFSAITYLSLTALSFTAGSATQDYFIGFVLSTQVLAAVVLLWLFSPLDDLRHERDVIAPQELSLWRRVYWAFCVDHSVRAVGWTHQVGSVPPRPKEARWAFVRSRLLRLVRNFLIADAGNTYVLSTKAFDALPAQGYARRLLTISIWMCTTHGSVNVQYYILALLSVGLGVGLPADWPDVFGRVSDAYTLRNFWGKVWHQNLRRFFTPIGRFVSRFLGFHRGTNASSYTQLYTAFILSGLIHSVGDAMVGWEWAGTSLPFFLIQAVAITAEDGVIALSRWAGIVESSIIRLVGYAWVFMWGAVTFSMYLQLSIDAGWGWVGEWPISPAGTLVKALWS